MLILIIVYFLQINIFSLKNVYIIANIQRNHIITLTFKQKSIISHIFYICRIMDKRTIYNLSKGEWDRRSTLRLLEMSNIP